MSEFFDTADDGVEFDPALDSVVTQDPAYAAAVGSLFEAAVGTDVAGFEELATFGARIEAGIDSGRILSEQVLWAIHDEFGSSLEDGYVEAGMVADLVLENPSEEQTATAEVFLEYFDATMGNLDAYADTGNPRLWDETLTWADIETLAATDVVAAIEDDNREYLIPENFSAHAADLWEAMGAFADSSYDPSQLAALEESEREAFLLLAGVADSEARAEWLGVLSELETGLTADTEDLLDAAAHGILADPPLSPTGSYELADRERLLADWDVLLEGVYDGYEFRTYAGTDVVTVTDSALETIEHIDVEIEYPPEIESLVDSEALDGPELYSAYPLAVGEETPFTATVYYHTGETKENPTWLSYEVIGPTFDPDDPDFEGPTLPGEFATVEGTNITAQKPTGNWTADDDTGPIVLQAVAEENGETVTGSTETSAVALGAGGFFEWDSSGSGWVTLQFAHEDATVTEGATVGVEYWLEHGGDGHGGTATLREGVGDSVEAVSVESLPSTDPGTFDTDTMTLAATNPTETTGSVETTATGIDETAARNISLVPDAVNTTAHFVSTCPSCDGDDGDGGASVQLATTEIYDEWNFQDPWSAHWDFGATGWAAGGGTVDFAPGTSTSWENRSPSITIDEEETRTLAIYGNSPAVAADEDSLADGTVHWRTSDDEGSQNYCDPCTTTAMTPVDLTLTSGGLSASASGSASKDGVDIVLDQTHDGDPHIYDWEPVIDDDVDRDGQTVAGTLDTSAGDFDVDIGLNDDDEEEDDDEGEGGGEVVSVELTIDGTGGDGYEVDWVVENEGTEDITVDISYDAPGEPVETATYNIDPGGAVEYTSTYESPAPGETSTHSVTADPGGSDSESIGGDGGCDPAHPNCG